MRQILSFSSALNFKFTYPEDEGGKLMPHIQLERVSARLARGRDDAALGHHLEHRLGVLALLAEDELADESVKKVLELVRVVGAVDDVALVLEVELSLGAELAAKVLGAIWKIR